jgi:hypothetical protein
MTGNFADNGDFHVTVGFFYMPQICDMGPTALLPLRRTGCSGFFRPEKSDGFGRVRTRELGSHIYDYFLLDVQYLLDGC